jgi:predicted Zn finger-like uncharacterized protein
MNVSCPECQSVFRVDPTRVPGPGVRARCSVCGGVIPITAARSWTDDFATPHDAASLTASPRVAGRPGTGASATVADRSISGEIGRGLSGGIPAPAALGGAVPPSSPTAGIPRNPTPTRVPPFAPGRRPTPPGVTSIPSGASRPPAPQAPAGRPAVPGQASQASGLVPPSSAPASPPRAPTTASAASAAPPNAGASGAPPRVPEVPIGAPINGASMPVSPPAPTRPGPTAVSGGAQTSARPTADDQSARAAPSLRGGGSPGSSASGAEPSATTQSKAPINPFLANDPNQKAKRLARALVSDMVAYHPQKRDEGVRAGTLKQLFREEIKKSYEEYVDQIGKEFAESTSHFQDALNDVLAGGRKVF